MAASRSVRQREKERRTVTILSVLRQAIVRGVSRDLAIAKAVEAGGTYQAIGDELGLSRQRVHQIVSLAD
jgi:DNA-directed RNA polymerase sigma subunit (sigma70/sigma32)